MTITDPTFYRSPAEAIAAPTEKLAYVVAFDRAGEVPDALAVLDVDEASDAYGSIVWTLLGLHTLHLGTDIVESLVLTALMFTRHGHQGRRFSDVEDNAFYWIFVVVSWLPIYFILYWFPRFT